MTSNLQGDDAFVWEHAEESVDLNVPIACFANGVIDDGSSHVDTTGHFDALQAWTGVHFEHHGSVVALQQVHASHVEAQHSGSTAGYDSELFGQVNRFHRTVEVEIRAEFAPTGASAHGRHHFVAYDDDADVTAVALSHVFLNQHVPACVKQPLDEALRFVGRVPEEHALSLRTFGDFDDDGEPSDGLDGMFDVTHITHVHRSRNWNAVSCKDLAGPEFVTALKDACSAVGGPYAELVKVAQQGRAVAGDGMADAGDDRFVFERFSIDQDFDAALVDKQGTGQGINDGHVKATVLGLLHQSPGAVEARAPGQHGKAEVHATRRRRLPFHSIVHARTSVAEAFKWSANQRQGMDDDERADESEAQEHVPSEVLVDEDRDDILEEMSLDQREEALKRSRWNVFMFLGIAVILFGFALFPMPFSADYQASLGGAQATKDVGLIWGMPVPGDDITDVPVRVSVDIDQPPPTHAELVAFMIQTADCTDPAALSDGQVEAESGSSDHGFATSMGRVTPGSEEEFQFRVDPGQYCLIVKFRDIDGLNADESGTATIEIDGRVWPNQAIAGLLGLVTIALAAFSFIGAQRHGNEVRAMKQPKEASVESSVLAAAGPSGPPAAGPSGPPSAGPSGPPSNDEPEPESDGPKVLQEDEDGTAWLDAGNGYVHRRMPDGDFDQTIFVPNPDGDGFVPNEA